MSSPFGAPKAAACLAGSTITVLRRCGDAWASELSQQCSVTSSAVVAFMRQVMSQWRFLLQAARAGSVGHWCRGPRRMWPRTRCQPHTRLRPRMHTACACALTAEGCWFSCPLNKRVVCCADTQAGFCMRLLGRLGVAASRYRGDWAVLLGGAAAVALSTETHRPGSSGCAHSTEKACD